MKKSKGGTNVVDYFTELYNFGIDSTYGDSDDDDNDNVWNIKMLTNIYIVKIMVMIMMIIIMIQMTIVLKRNFLKESPTEILMKLSRERTV